METTYNGWKNYQTWNVALWVSNDEPLYRAAVQVAQDGKGKRNAFSRFLDSTGLRGFYTPDRVKWDGQKLDFRALSEMIMEFAD